MTAKIFIDGLIGEDVKLLDVVRQFKSYDDVTDIDIVINSIGGSVNVADDIYEYFAELGEKYNITTTAIKAYSAASKIFTVGNTRKVYEGEKILMIHNPWIEKVSGDAEKLETIAAELKIIEEDYENHYSQVLGIDSEVVSNLMKSDTFISSSEAVELGFATEEIKDIKAVAQYNFKKSIHMKDAEKKEAKNGFLALAKFFGFEVKTDEKPEAKAELKLQDATGTEVIFPDLNEGDTPEVGDSATVDGAPIPDGSYIMPSLEDSTVIFEGGKITEIQPKENEDEGGEDSEQAQAKAEEAKAEEVQQISVWTMEVVNTSFAEGDVVKYKDYDGNEYIVGSGEFQTSDGRRIVTDATGTIVKIKDADSAKEPPIDADAKFDEAKKEIAEKIKAELKSEYEDQLKEKEAEIIALKREISSPEFKAQQDEDTEPKPKAQTGADVLRMARRIK